MTRLFAFFLQLVCSSAMAQPNVPVLPNWSDIKIFGWHANTLPDSALEQITTIQVNVNIKYAWGQPAESYICGYERRDSFFESRFACFDSPGKVWPPEHLGEDAFVHDSLFHRRFDAKYLFQVLRSIQQPAAQWQESDFDPVRTKFRIDLSKIPHGSGARVYNIAGADAPTYIITVRFFNKNQLGAGLAAALIPLDYLPCAKAETLQSFPLHTMLEWLYCYQLSHLFFPEGVALNQTHFNEKNLERLAAWAKTVFPELNQ